MAAAYVARKMGVPATIVVPSSSPQLVVQKLQHQGVTVKIIGKVKQLFKRSLLWCRWQFRSGHKKRQSRV